MNECLVAVAFGDFRFHTQNVVNAATQQWPTATFVLPTGTLANLLEGQLQLPFPDGEESEVLAGFLPGGNGISLDGTVEGMAEFIAWLSGQEEFPSDESVVVLGWTSGEYPLPPATTAEALIA